MLLESCVALRATWEEPPTDVSDWLQTFEGWDDVGELCDGVVYDL
jgi:hypothetical protein